MGRTAAFSTGLNEQSAKQNAMVPKSAMQTSVLQPPRPSMNGMSANDYQRVLPGGTTLPSQNGSSPDSWQASTYMRLQGRSAV